MIISCVQIHVSVCLYTNVYACVYVYIYIYFFFSSSFFNMWIANITSHACQCNALARIKPLSLSVYLDAVMAKGTKIKKNWNWEIEFWSWKKSCCSGFYDWLKRIWCIKFVVYWTAGLVFIVLNAKYRKIKVKSVWFHLT